MLVNKTIKFYQFVFALTVITAFFISCDSSRVFDNTSRIKDSAWKRQEPVSFDFSIKDTTALYNVYIQVRNTTDYAFSNLYLFLTTKDAAGQFSKDTIECVLADPDGKWLGKGLGKLKENRILIKKDMRWQIPGSYHIQIEQAMRKEILEGISDIGLRIEKE